MRGLAGLGDVDGDGVGDVAVGAPFDDDGEVDAGAIWILYLNPDGSARAAKKISQGNGGFAGDLEERSLFGHSLASVGDLDRDGFVDLAAGEFGGGRRRWILFLDGSQDVLRTSTSVPLDETVGLVGDLDGDGLAELAAEGLKLRFLAADGRLRKTLRVWPGLNGMPEDRAVNVLGNYAVAGLGDLDGDGTLELAAGDIGDRQSGGALWILSLARTPVQNGSGTNPLVYKEVAEPVIGETWEAVLDCRGHRGGVATIFGFDRPLSGVFLPAGELLVDPSSRRLFQLLAPHAGGPVRFSAAVPPDAALVNLQVFSQGACGGAPGATLGNALYLLVGGPR